MEMEKGNDVIDKYCMIGLAVLVVIVISINLIMCFS